MANDFKRFNFAIPVAPDVNNGVIGAQLDFLFAHGWNPPEHLLRGTSA